MTIKRTLNHVGLDPEYSIYSYSSGDPLRYEKRMIDRWMERELSPRVAAAATR